MPIEQGGIQYWSLSELRERMAEARSLHNLLQILERETERTVEN